MGTEDGECVRGAMKAPRGAGANRTEGCRIFLGAFYLGTTILDPAAQLSRRSIGRFLDGALGLAVPLRQLGDRDLPKVAVSEQLALIGLESLQGFFRRGQPVLAVFEVIEGLLDLVAGIDEASCPIAGQYG